MGLAAELMGSMRSSVLGALVLKPDASLHVRELARVARASPGSLHRELRTMMAQGLLIREERGRQVHYRANTDSPAYPGLRLLLGSLDGMDAEARYGAAPTPDTPPPPAARPKLHLPIGKLTGVCRAHGVRELALFRPLGEHQGTESARLTVDFANADVQPDVTALAAELGGLIGLPVELGVVARLVRAT
jgi:hypothetical protein